MAQKMEKECLRLGTWLRSALLKTSEDSESSNTIEQNKSNKRSEDIKRNENS